MRCCAGFNVHKSLLHDHGGRQLSPPSGTQQYSLPIKQRAVFGKTFIRKTVISSFQCPVLKRILARVELSSSNNFPSMCPSPYHTGTSLSFSLSLSLALCLGVSSSLRIVRHTAAAAAVFCISLTVAPFAPPPAAAGIRKAGQRGGRRILGRPEMCHGVRDYQSNA